MTSDDLDIPHILEALAQDVQPSSTLAARLRTVTSDRPPPRKRGLIALLIVAVIIAPGGVILRDRLRDGASSERIEAGTSERIEAGTPASGQVANQPRRPADTWRLLPPAPIRGRVSHTAVWTGAEMIVWGGLSTNDGHLSDGAAYDPEKDSWRVLPPGPLDGRSSPQSVWTGTEVIVWGGSGCCGGGPGDRRAAPESLFRVDGAAYNPTTDKWRRVPPAPVDGQDSPAVVWTGHEMLVWGARSTGPGTYSVAAAAYNPQENTWRKLSAAGLPARAESTAVWAGTELIVWGGRSDVGYMADGAAYDPVRDRWRPVPPAPLSARGSAMMFWTGREVLVVGGFERGPCCNDAASYDPALNTWRRIADPGGPVSPPAVAAGRRLLLSNTSERRVAGYVYDAQSDTWRSRPAAPIALAAETTAVWTGEEMIAWGGAWYYDPIPERSDGAAYTPPSPS